MQPGSEHLCEQSGFGHMCVQPGSGHLSVQPGSGHLCVQSGFGRMCVQPGSGHLCVQAGFGHMCACNFGRASWALSLRSSDRAAIGTPGTAIGTRSLLGSMGFPGDLRVDYLAVTGLHPITASSTRSM